MLSPELLKIIVCPACRKPLQYSEAESTLTCSACGRIYPIREGIPVLLVDQAIVKK